MPSVDWRKQQPKTRKWTKSAIQVQGQPNKFLKQWTPEGHTMNVFPTVSELASWTDEFYNQFLVDPNWSKLETQTLFDLCKKFSCNFYIVYDRWEGTVRTIPVVLF